MDLLIVESDVNLARLIVDVLGREGHTVRAATDARSALAMFAARAPAVLLLASYLPDLGGMDLLRALRQREREARPREPWEPPYAPMTVVVMADTLHGELRRSLDDLHVTHVLPKPVSLLDLADLVRRAAESGSSAPADPNPDNLAQLAGWWARRATGVLRIETSGAASSWVLFANGGPVGADGMAATVAALRAGTLDMEPCDVDGDGDHPGFGRQLWIAARGWVASRAPPEEALWLGPTAWSPAILDLPLPQRTRLALRDLDRPTSALQLANRAGAALAELLLDSRALATLGLIRTSPLPPDPPPESAPHGDGSTITRPTLPTTPGPPRSRPPADAPYSTAPTPPLPPSSAAPARPVAPGRRTALLAEVDPPTEPVAARSTGSTPGRSVSSATPAGSALGPGDLARQIVRLRRELRVVQNAEPWTVLGLPRGTAMELVQRAGVRMLARYEPLTLSPNPELAAVARVHADRIRYAVDAIRRDGSALGPSEESLIQSGRAALEREDFQGAERRFAAARDLSPDSATALAHLGYARALNPTLDADARMLEGEALLELALSFDSACTEAWYFLALLAYGRNVWPAAERNLYELFKLAPEHAEGIALARKIRIEQGGGPPDRSP